VKFVEKRWGIKANSSKKIGDRGIYHQTKIKINNNKRYRKEREGVG